MEFGLRDKWTDARQKSFGRLINIIVARSNRALTADEKWRLSRSCACYSVRLLSCSLSLLLRIINYLSLSLPLSLSFRSIIRHLATPTTYTPEMTRTRPSTKSEDVSRTEPLLESRSDWIDKAILRGPPPAGQVASQLPRLDSSCFCSFSSPLCHLHNSSSSSSSLYLHCRHCHFECLFVFFKNEPKNKTTPALLLTSDGHQRLSISACLTEVPPRTLLMPLSQILVFPLTWHCLWTIRARQIEWRKHLLESASWLILSDCFGRFFISIVLDSKRDTRGPTRTHAVLAHSKYSALLINPTENSSLIDELKYSLRERRSNEELFVPHERTSSDKSKNAVTVAYFPAMFCFPTN